REPLVGRGRGLRGLGVRSPDARGGRLSGGGEPRDAPRSHRPQARLAGRALRQVRRRPAQVAADRTGLAFRWPGDRQVKALLFERKLAKYAAAAVAGRLVPGKGAAVGPISLQDIDE